MSLLNKATCSDIFWHALWTLAYSCRQKPPTSLKHLPGRFSFFALIVVLELPGFGKLTRQFSVSVPCLNRAQGGAGHCCPHGLCSFGARRESCLTAGAVLQSELMWSDSVLPPNCSKVYTQKDLELKGETMVAAVAYSPTAALSGLLCSKERHKTMVYILMHMARRHGPGFWAFIERRWWYLVFPLPRCARGCVVSQPSLL